MDTFELMEHTLRFWVKRDLGRFADVDKLFRSYRTDFSEVKEGTKELLPVASYPYRGTLYLWTSKTRYTITFTVKEDGLTYFGCIACSRKWRAGEDWNRGRDLPDGEFTETVWQNILRDIVSYELESPVALRDVRGSKVDVPITNEENPET